MKYIQNSCLQNFKKKLSHKPNKEFILKDDCYTLFYWDWKCLSSCFTNNPVIWKPHFQEEYVFSQYLFFRMFLGSIEFLNLTSIFEGPVFHALLKLSGTLLTLSIKLTAASTLSLAGSMKTLF